MKAIVLAKPGLLEPIELPEAAAPGPGEALVAIRRIGVCGTDLHAFHGRQPFFSYPRIRGHGLAGEVLAVGPGVGTVEVGDRAALRGGPTAEFVRRGPRGARHGRRARDREVHRGGTRRGGGRPRPRVAQDEESRSGCGGDPAGFRRARPPRCLRYGKAGGDRCHDRHGAGFSDKQYSHHETHRYW